MSKAFTRENDEVEQSPPRQLPPPFSGTAKNYFTVRGLERLEQELSMISAEPNTEVGRQRIFEIKQRLQFAIPLPPPPPPWNQVLFGATVKVRNQKGEKTAYHIVGTNETDPDHHYISWLSPLGKALLKAHIGDRVHFTTPDGLENLEITNIHYE